MARGLRSAIKFQFRILNSISQVKTALPREIDRQRRIAVQLDCARVRLIGEQASIVFRLSEQKDI
jgi:hypothetical protein